MHSIPAISSFAMLLAVSLAFGQAPDPAKKEPPKKEPAKKEEPVDPNKLPMTKLDPAKRVIVNLSTSRYPVTTRSAECQAMFDQGLGYFHSYVWIEAARCFETATKADPDCALAWWGLSRAIERWGKGSHTPALKKAQDLLPKASHRESLLIKARLAEKGMLEGVTPELRKKEATKHLDELLTLYDDDEEGWFARAQIAEGPNAGVPYYKALLRVNPLHGGANHELVHHYENIGRPALGWPHALKYMEATPGIAHAFHMQSHLGMRLGRWEKTTEWSGHAIELQRAYHKELNVKPADDWQYSHHLETLTMSLAHDGRYQQAREIQKLSRDAKYEHRLPWFRLHLAEGAWDEALAIADLFKKDKTTRSWLRALVFLKMHELDRAKHEIDVLQEAYRGKREDKELELRLWETQGQLLCLQGGAEGGLKLLEKTVKKTVNDYRHHSWGNGAYYMETWGVAALNANRLEVAEEAFLEAIAHDSGSVRGALGMQIVCERQGRTEEAVQFGELAQRFWKRADAGRLQEELDRIRGEPKATTAAK